MQRFIPLKPYFSTEQRSSAVSIPITKFIITHGALLRHSQDGRIKPHTASCSLSSRRRCRLGWLPGMSHKARSLCSSAPGLIPILHACPALMRNSLTSNIRSSSTRISLPSAVSVKWRRRTSCSPKTAQRSASRKSARSSMRTRRKERSSRLGTPLRRLRRQGTTSERGEHERAIKSTSGVYDL